VAMISAISCPFAAQRDFNCHPAAYSAIAITATRSRDIASPGRIRWLSARIRPMGAALASVFAHRDRSRQADGGSPAVARVLAHYTPTRASRKGSRAVAVRPIHQAACPAATCRTRRSIPPPSARVRGIREEARRVRRSAPPPMDPPRRDRARRRGWRCVRARELRAGRETSTRQRRELRSMPAPLRFPARSTRHRGAD